MKKILAIVLVVIATLGAYVYYTPYLALKNLAAAAQKQDTAQVAKYIDSPSLKASISEQVQAMMTKELMNSEEMKDNPFSILALGMITPLVEAASTSISSPTGMTQILNGQDPLNEKDEKPAETATQNDKLATAETGYADFNTFNVRIKNPDNEPLTLIFERDGLISWKMSKMQLPEMKMK